jgi:hypothetical protein
MLPEQVTSTVSQSQQVSDFVGWWRLCAALERQFMRKHVACLSLRGRVSVLRDARGHSGNDSTMLEVTPASMPKEAGPGTSSQGLEERDVLTLRLPEQHYFIANKQKVHKKAIEKDTC